MLSDQKRPRQTTGKKGRGKRRDVAVFASAGMLSWCANSKSDKKKKHFKWKVSQVGGLVVMLCQSVGLSVN